MINDLIRRTQTQIDEIEWENAEDPRIQDLIKELNYYKELEKKGEFYDSGF